MKLLFTNAYYLNNVTVSFFHYLLLGLPTLKRLSFEHNICVPSNLSLKVNVPLGAEKHWLLRTDGNNHSIRDRKRKRRKKRKKNQKCNFFLICLKVSYFEKSQQKSHEVVITFLLPLLKTRTWVLWHEIVQSYMKTADVNMKTWKKMKKFSLQAAFDTFLLLDVLWKAGVESWSTTFKMGSFFDEKLKSSPSCFGQVWRLSTSQWLQWSCWTIGILGQKGFSKAL